MKKTLGYASETIEDQTVSVFEFLDEEMAEEKGDWLLLLEHPYLAENDGLGGAMMAEYLSALRCEEVMPRAIIFLHAAVGMLLEDSPYLEDLCALENQGVAIYACRLSADYLQHSGHLCLGQAVSMRLISQLIASTVRVVTL